MINLNERLPWFHIPSCSQLTDSPVERSPWLSQHMAFKPPQGDSGLPDLALSLPTITALLIESYPHPSGSICRLPEQIQSLDHHFKSTETQHSFLDVKIPLDFMFFFPSLDRQVKSWLIQKAAVVSHVHTPHSYDQYQQIVVMSATQYKQQTNQSRHFFLCKWVWLQMRMRVKQ